MDRRKIAINDAFALITGASSGIGECFVRALAARKWNLAVSARSAAKLEALAAEMRRVHGVRVECFPANLSLLGAGSNLAQAVADRGLSVGLLINNAGFGVRGEFWELPLDRQEEMLRLNIEAVVELTHRLTRPMVERRSGGIINVASVAGFMPVAYTSAYAATKAFIISFSMAIKEEVAPYGIRVVTLCPGGTKTNFFEAGGYGDRSKPPGGLESPEAVVAKALGALDGGGGLVVPRLLNKLSVFSLRLTSRGAAARIAARIFKPALK